MESHGIKIFKFMIFISFQKTQKLPIQERKHIRSGFFHA